MSLMAESGETEELCPLYREQYQATCVQAVEVPLAALVTVRLVFVRSVLAMYLKVPGIARLVKHHWLGRRVQ
jgi:hypothetical protein